MSAHNFTVGAKQNKVQTPLTMEEVARRAPSALALRPYAAMSAKYTYVPTINIIEGMIKAGFQPFAASQSLTRIADKKAFTKHMLRFRHADMGALVVGDVVPEVVVINSHDGACAFRLIAGLYRLVCSNGLMVSDAEIESISVRHTGNILQAVVDGSYTIVGNAAKALGTVKQWRQLQLTDGERHAFATSAHILRFADAEGKTTTPITPDQLLVPRRYDDQGKDLWTTFNVLQENALKGGLSGIQRDAEGRRVRSVSTRQIRGIDGNVQLNRSLWTLAERLAELKGKDVPFSEAEVVEAAA
ncbi:MAG: DUF932 domain-containing protein [Candidatus Sulfotelmatobacter sp.]